MWGRKLKKGMKMNKMTPITEKLLDRIELTEKAEQYEKEAQACRIIAKTMHEFRIRGFSDYDKEAEQLEGKAQDVRRFIKEYYG